MSALCCAIIAFWQVFEGSSFSQIGWIKPSEMGLTILVRARIEAYRTRVILNHVNAHRSQYHRNLTVGNNNILIIPSRTANPSRVKQTLIRPFVPSSVRYAPLIPRLNTADSSAKRSIPGTSSQLPHPSPSQPTNFLHRPPSPHAPHQCRSSDRSAPYAQPVSSTRPAPPAPSSPPPPPPSPHRPTAGATSPPPRPAHHPPARTKTTTIHPPVGCGGSRRARNTRRKDGRTFGTGDSSGVWDWGSWLMLISRILREFVLLSFVGLSRGWGVGEGRREKEGLGRMDGMRRG